MGSNYLNQLSGGQKPIKACMLKQSFKAQYPKKYRECSCCGPLEAVQPKR